MLCVLGHCICIQKNHFRYRLASAGGGLGWRALSQQTHRLIGLSLKPAFDWIKISQRQEVTQHHDCLQTELENGHCSVQFGSLHLSMCLKLQLIQNNSFRDQIIEIKERTPCSWNRQQSIKKATSCATANKSSTPENIQLC